MSLIDLRRYNITSEEELLEFIELIVTKLPQAARLIKSQRMKIVSLNNQLRSAQSAPQSAQNDPDASVLDQLVGNKQAPVPLEENKAATRLDQLRNAQNPEADAIVPLAPEESLPLPPAPVAPGEIGNLQIPNEQTKLPNKKLTEEEEIQAMLLEPNDPLTEEEVAEIVMEEEAAKTAGSKSQLPSDDEIQSETSKPKEPTLADKTPSGQLIAKNTNGQLGNKLEKK